MTEDEQTTIAEIIATADSACSTCVSYLAAQIEKALPGKGWAAQIDKAFEKAEGYPILEEIEDKLECLNL